MAVLMSIAMVLNSTPVNALAEEVNELEAIVEQAQPEGEAVADEESSDEEAVADGEATADDEEATSDEEAAVTLTAAAAPQLTAQADGGSAVTTTINLKTYGGEGDATAEDLALLNSRYYYLLTTIKPEGGGNVLGWAINEVSFDSSTETVTVEQFYKYVDEGNQTSDTIEYNPATMDIETRLYQSPEYADSYRALTNPWTKASDVIDGYNPVSNNYEDYSSVLTLKRWDGTKLAIQVEMNELGKSIKPEDNYYIHVTVEHKTSENTYYVKPLSTGDGETTKTYIANEWYDNNGNAKLNERYTGNEPNVEVRIVKVKKDTKISDIVKLDQNSCTIIADGGMVNEYIVNYVAGETVNKTDREEDRVHVIKLKLVTATEDYNFKSILDGGLVYGITADRFEQQKHDVQSNFATNYYASNGVYVNPNLSGTNKAKSPGSIAIGEFVSFNGQTATSGLTHSDTDTLNVGNTNNNPLIVYTDSADRISGAKQHAYVVETSKEDVAANIVEPIISYMKQVSADMLTHEANTAPTVAPNGDVTIDSSSYADGTTIYVDADALADKAFTNGSHMNKITLRKKPNQVVVFNFKKTEKVALGQFKVELVDDEGKVTTVNSESDIGTGTEQNKKLDALAKTIVWNLASAKQVVMQATVGMVLIPNEDSVAETQATANTGWIITDGYFTNKGGEWHYVYGDLETDVSSTNLSVNKLIGTKTPSKDQKFSFKLEHLNTAVSPVAW